MNAKFDTTIDSDKHFVSQSNQCHQKIFESKSKRRMNRQITNVYVLNIINTLKRWASDKRRTGYLGLGLTISLIKFGENTNEFRVLLIINLI